MSKIKYRQFLADLEKEIGFCPSHSKISEILNYEVTANALSNRYSMDGYIRSEETQKIIEFYNNQSGSVDRKKFVNIPYWELLPENMRSLDVDYIPVQKRVIEIGWKLNPDKLRIVPMVGDKMTAFWYHINEDDLLIIDTSQNNILGNGVYFATSRNNSMFWIREMQNLVNGDVQIKGYSPSGETVKTFTREQLNEVDFKIIGKVIKNVSFRL